MKSIKHRETKEVLRVSKHWAKQLIATEKWHYTTKSVWRNQIRRMAKFAWIASATIR